MANEKSQAVTQRVNHPNVWMALAAVQQELGGLVGKDATGSKGEETFGYTTLAGYLQHVVQAAARHGLAVIAQHEQRRQPDGTVDVVTTTSVVHGESGTLVSTPVGVPVYIDGRSRILPQDVGAACTYGRKYGIASLFALAQDEDVDARVAQAAEAEEADRRRRAREVKEMDERKAAKAKKGEAKPADPQPEAKPEKSEAKPATTGTTGNRANLETLLVKIRAGDAGLLDQAEAYIPSVLTGDELDIAKAAIADRRKALSA